MPLNCFCCSRGSQVTFSGLIDPTNLLTQNRLYKPVNKCKQARFEGKKKTKEAQGRRCFFCGGGGGGGGGLSAGVGGIPAAQRGPCLVQTAWL